MLVRNTFEILGDAESYEVDNFDEIATEIIQTLFRALPDGRIIIEPPADLGNMNEVEWSWRLYADAEAINPITEYEVCASGDLPDRAMRVKELSRWLTEAFEVFENGEWVKL